MSWFLQFLHPGKVSAGGGYWFWSGLGGGSPVFAVAVGYLVHHNCHVDGCKRMGVRDDTVGAPACRRHHTRGHLHGTAPR